MKKILFSTLFAAVLSIQAGYAGTGVQHEVRVSAVASHTSIPRNRQIILKVRITWVNTRDTVSVADVSDPLLTNFAITGTAAANRAEAVPGGTRQVRETEYILEPQGLGMGYIEPISVAYTVSPGQDTVCVHTRRFGISITDAVAEPAGHAFPWMPVFAGIAAAAAALLIVSRRTARAKVSTEPDPCIPEEEALARAKKLMGPDRGNPTETLTSLVRLFRTYLNQEFGITAPEATSPQLISGLEQAGAEASFIHQLSDVFSRAHTVAFSGGKARPADADTAYSVMEAFLQKRLSEKRAAQTAGLKKVHGIGGLFTRFSRRGT